MCFGQHCRGRRRAACAVGNGASDLVSCWESSAEFGACGSRRTSGRVFAAKGGRPLPRTARPMARQPVALARVLPVPGAPRPCSRCRSRQWPSIREPACSGSWLARQSGCWPFAARRSRIGSWHAFAPIPLNRGRTCREGLWRYSRHPNYFFEWLHWFAYVALAAGVAPLAAGLARPAGDVRLPALDQRHAIHRGAGAAHPRRGLPRLPAPHVQC